MVFELQEILDIPPFSLRAAEKGTLFQRGLSALSCHHYERCIPYRRCIDLMGVRITDLDDVEQVPFLPVRLFKDQELLSVDRSQVVKTMTSSGTSGQSVSRIFLDKITAFYQTAVLTKIVSSFIGTKRLPMLIIDAPSTTKNRTMFSARGAGILGFSMFGRDVTYALDDALQLDVQAICQFLEKYPKQPVLLFGFTFMIWENFYKALTQSGLAFPLEQGILIHGGGWKKLADRGVHNDEFKRCLREACGLQRIYNYYGMVEQTGSIFMECEEGRLHCSIFSDILIRDHRDFSSCGAGEQGLVQLLSLLPLSYPGHSLLSEDLGVILGVDDCPCGRNGKSFAILGRIKDADVRGCSDVYAP